jgi:hypothetical protein
MAHPNLQSGFFRFNNGKERPLHFPSTLAQHLEGSLPGVSELAAKVSMQTDVTGKGPFYRPMPELGQ